MGKMNKKAIKPSKKPKKPKLYADFQKNEASASLEAQKRHKKGRRAWIQTKTVNGLIKQLDSLEGRINKIKGRYAKYAG